MTTDETTETIAEKRERMTAEVATLTKTQRKAYAESRHAHGAGHDESMRYALTTV